VTELGTRTTALIAAAAVSLTTLALADGRAAVTETRQQTTCYPAQFSAFLARRIAISDSVSQLTAIVRRPLSVCAPATIDGAPSADPSGYLSCYEIGAPSIGKRNVGYVSNTFGTARVIVDAAKTVCTSSSTTSRLPVAIRLTCYAVVSPAGDKSAYRTVGDRFGTARESIAFGRPLTFCTQSSSGSTRPLHLMCYAMTSKITGTALGLTNEWGTLRASLGLRDRICVQSSLKPR
jgi:hypothetical protein